MRARLTQTQPAIAALLAWRDLKARLTSLWFYALASAVCGIAAFFATAFAKSFETESVAVSADPFATVHAFVLLFLAIGLGVRAAAALSWEREHRTMEVLLSGPVTIGALVVAKLATELVVLAALNAVYTAFLAVIQPGQDVASVVSSASAYWRLSVLVTPMIGLGLLVSALSQTVRGSVIAFLLVVLALAALEGSAAWLRAQDPNDLSLATIYVRGVLGQVSDWLALFSPVSRAADLARFAAGNPAPSSARLLGATGILVCLVGLSILATRLRGAVT